MRRRLSTLLITGLLACATMAIVPTPPADAVGVCANTLGSLSTGTPMFYPVTFASSGSTTMFTQRAPVTTGFAVNWVVGTCINTETPTLKAIAATGTVVGWCGHSTASGVTSDGYRFSWVEVGFKLVFTGELFGFVSGYTPDVVNGESCLTGADSFIVGWNVFAKAHCTVTKSKGLTGVTIPIPATHVLPGLGVHATTQGGTMHYWTKVCV